MSATWPTSPSTSAKRAAWFEKQQQDLLPVEYFHVVFTVPDTLNGLALAHPAEFYNLLFRAARETLAEAAQSSRYLGGQIGGLLVLHTWGQNLSLHPHLHVIVPGGAISPDGQAWRSCPRGFFLPVRVLSRLFRGKLLAGLLEAYDAGRLPMSGGPAALADPQQFRRFLSPLYRTDWVVYAKPPVSGQPETILGYLAIILVTSLTTTILAMVSSILFRRTSVSMMTSYLVVMILFALPVAVKLFADLFYPASAGTVELRKYLFVSPFAAVFSLPLTLNGDTVLHAGDWWRWTAPAFLIFYTVLDLLLVAVMLRLFNVRWRVAR